MCRVFLLDYLLLYNEQHNFLSLTGLSTCLELESGGEERASGEAARGDSGLSRVWYGLVGRELDSGASSDRPGLVSRVGEHKERVFCSGRLLSLFKKSPDRGDRLGDSLQPAKMSLRDRERERSSHQRSCKQGSTLKELIQNAQKILHWLRL